MTASTNKNNGDDAAEATDRNASAPIDTESRPMRVVRSAEYGPPSEMAVEQVQIPEPGPDEVLVRVGAASVNPADWHLLRGDPYIARLTVGLRQPRNTVLGCDVSGDIAALGVGVEGVALGDEVVGSTFMEGFGGFADYAIVQRKLLVPKPPELPHEAAAALPLAGSTALEAVRDHGKVAPGQRVLIIGASGGVGTFAVQLAAHLGAEVTGVCSTAKVELVRSLGADHVVDYTKRPVHEMVGDAEPFDLVVQVAGSDSISTLRGLTARKGTVVILSGDAKGHLLGAARRVIAAAVINPFVSQRLVNFTVAPNENDLATLVGLAGAGELTSVIDRTYGLDQVPAALAYLEEGHAAGKVIITP